MVIIPYARSLFAMGWNIKAFINNLSFVQEKEDWYDSGIWAEQLKCIQ